MTPNQKAPWLLILWPTVENGYEREYISLRDATSTSNLLTLAQCEVNGENYVYRYPAKSNYANNKINLTYTESPNEWKDDWGWRIEAGRTEVHFSSDGNLVPKEVVWHRRGKHGPRPLKPNQEWYLLPDTNSEIMALIENIANFEDAPSQDVAEMFLSVEGKKILRKHFFSERSPKLIKEFKAQLEDYSCEVCEFSFSKLYGSIGAHYIEAHHKTPLTNFDGARATTIEDLIAVCSNCHRMLHRIDPPVSVDELKAIVRSHKAQTQT